METVTTRNDDGTYDIVQRGPLAGALAPAELEQLYWDEVRASTLGLVSYSRNAIRIFGVWPQLIAFERGAGERRQIVGGLFARHPYGSVIWAAHDGKATVAVERFAPRLPAPLFRLERWFHDLVGRRFLARVSRAVG
jgi:hypothetical protein